MRYESQGAIYPITSAIHNQAHPASNFAIIAPSLWHDRLGHPGASILDSLRRNNLIQCNKLSYSTSCYSCPLERHIKLPFVASNSSTLMSFDIIQCDIWTSPILSSVGHRYYLVVLDDYSNYLWTFSLSKKSQV